MSTRILRDKRHRSRPPWPDSDGNVQRTRVHACGRGCPLHDAPAPAEFGKGKKARRG